MWTKEKLRKNGKSSMKTLAASVMKLGEKAVKCPMEKYAWSKNLRVLLA
jgi:hypothetical protein